MASLSIKIQAFRKRMGEKTYEIKRMWASTYLNDTFFGRIRTTSQCEGIHSLIKHYIGKKCYLLDLMHNLNEAVRQYQTNELLSDFKSLFSSPVLTTCFEDIEKEAANIFTHNMFKEVKNEILEVSKLNVVSGIWIATWMKNCIWIDDYNIYVDDATRMRIAIDLIMKSYNHEIIQSEKKHHYQSC
ncbi:hypothetical protein Ahy_A10g050663 [Arachis hypogaea]|uniref:Protein FAR1-RELATED SEQUENCE n=1 Tax=Arachis hypogaea TaxID=3818 RepID=A0A445BA07_ARAHY|nr:hypothetical protein Ahy_A10g050663 [Arachis hypogaea]